MARLIVELHVPLTPTSGLPDRVYQFPWLLEMEENVMADLPAGVEEFDSGEEFGDHYVFFLAGADEALVLTVARNLANRPGMPGGAFAMVTDDQAESFGLGRRVELG